MAGTAGAEASGLSSTFGCLKDDIEAPEAGLVARGIGGAITGVRPSANEPLGRVLEEAFAFGGSSSSKRKS